MATFGRACLEGHFDLIQTSTGEPFSSKDLKGKWALIYFGFTRCPDICPEQLEKLAYVIEAVDNGNTFHIWKFFQSIHFKLENGTQNCWKWSRCSFQLIVVEILLKK